MSEPDQDATSKATGSTMRPLGARPGLGQPIDPRTLPDVAWERVRGGRVLHAWQGTSLVALCGFGAFIIDRKPADGMVRKCRQCEDRLGKMWRFMP